MSQLFDIPIDGATDLVSDGDTQVSNALQTLQTGFSGPTAPTSPVAYMVWNDTTTGLRKQRNAANNAWIDKGTLADTDDGHRTLSNHTGTISAAQHAAQTDGTLHAAAIANGANGFLPGTDKAKLDSLASAVGAANLKVLTANGANASSWETASSIPGPGTVGTGELKTATGSLEWTNLLNNEEFQVALNAYSFFPNIFASGTGDKLRLSVNATDSADQVGRFSIFVVTTNSPTTLKVRWRYVTASDDPRMYAVVSADGRIVGIWESEDPVLDGDGNEQVPVGCDGHRVVRVSEMSLKLLESLGRGHDWHGCAMKAVTAHCRRRRLGELKSLDEVDAISERRWRDVFVRHAARAVAHLQGMGLGGLLIERCELDGDKLIMK